MKTNWPSVLIFGNGSNGTNVIANPTVTGSESDLTALQVGNEKYLVPQIPEDITGVWTTDTTIYISTLPDGDEVVYPNA